MNNNDKLTYKKPDITSISFLHQFTSMLVQHIWNLHQR